MSGEKTEQPTSKKLKDAREKGQVAVSKDVQILGKLLLFYAVFFWLSIDYDTHFAQLLDLIIETGFKERGTLSSSIISLAIDVFMVITIPLVMVCALAGTLTTWMQIGFLVAPEAVKPSFKKFDAVSTVKNMFSKKSLVQLLLTVCKVAILVLVAYLSFRGNIGDMLNSYRTGFSQMLSVLVETVKDLIFFSLGVFTILALLDWVMEKSHHIKNLRMSKQDLTDEQKQTQGNPQLKSHMKSQHRSILNSSLNKMSGAKAVVANPTHISVALDYEPGKHDIPFIVCMGADEDAFDIRRKAKELGIPVIVNVELARSLYKDCEEDEYIKKEHLVLAAEVFRAVMQLASEQNPVDIPPSS